MKTVWLLFFAAALSGAAQTNTNEGTVTIEGKTLTVSEFVALGANKGIYAYRYPLRDLNFRRYDLRPHFQWWEQQRTNSLIVTNAPPPSKSPLPGWVRITGNQVGSASYGWIVDAQIEDVPGKVRRERIFLLHPPIEDKAHFDELVANVTVSEAERERQRLIAAVQSKVAEDAKIKKETVDELRQTTATDQLYSKSQQLKQEHLAALEESTRAQNVAQSLDAVIDIAKINKTEYPPGDVYKLDFFAARTPRKYDGLRIYDVGKLVVKTPAK